MSAPWADYLSGMRPGPVDLRLRHLAETALFYREVLGLATVEGSDGTIEVRSECALLARLRPAEAEDDGSAHPGLYHMALLVSARLALAWALRRLLDRRYPLQGAADHGVSQAIYLADPEGNGIELYADQPRSAWPSTGEGLAMGTDPLDVQGLLRLTLADDDGGAPLRTARMGHVHLRVSNLADAVDFYAGRLGLELTQRLGTGAAFFACDGYHHHIGVNTWESAGARPAVPGAPGLSSFSLRLASWSQLEQAARRIGAEPHAEGFQAQDPSGNRLFLSAPSD